MGYDPPAPPPNEPYGNQQPAPAWPPPPATWPPPAAGYTVDTPIFFPFTYVHEKVTGHIADLREGYIGISPYGVTLQGRAQPRAEIYQPIIWLSFLCAEA